MSNNSDAPNIEYVQLIKWIGHYRINYYYKSLYIYLHSCNVAVGQCGKHQLNAGNFYFRFRFRTFKI